MENLFFTVLGVILGWIPPALLWVRDRFTSTKAPGITLAVRPHDRAGAMFQSKIHVDITNQIPGQSVRIAAPYFVFDNGGLLKQTRHGRQNMGQGISGCTSSPLQQKCMIGRTYIFDRAKRRTSGLALILNTQTKTSSRQPRPRRSDDYTFK